MFVYQFSHEDFQKLANLVGNMPWVIAKDAMNVIARVKEIKVDVETPKSDYVPQVEGK